jgi:hypothetical protein
MRSAAGDWAASEMLQSRRVSVKKKLLIVMRFVIATIVLLRSWVENPETALQLSGERGVLRLRSAVASLRSGQR